MGSVGRNLPSKQVAQIGCQTQCKLGLAVHACNASPWEAEAEGLEIPSHLQLYSRYRASPDYMRWRVNIYIVTDKKASDEENITIVLRLAGD